MSKFIIANWQSGKLLRTCPPASRSLRAAQRLAAQLGDSYPFRKLGPETDSSGGPARGQHSAGGGPGPGGSYSCFIIWSSGRAGWHHRRGAPAAARDGSARSGRWGAPQGIAAEAAAAAPLTLPLPQ
jgi:hypothetical protein